MKKLLCFILSAATAFSLLICTGPAAAALSNAPPESSSSSEVFLSPDLEAIPKYGKDAVIQLNDNYPDFHVRELTAESFIEFSELDSLGRTGGSAACIGKEDLPTEERGSIGSVKPSGWHTVRYDDIIKDKYLYNRCHVIGYQLCGENANPLNLFTGTRFLNVEGMLFYENAIADYIEETENHVLYRATPVYDGENLVAAGIQLEAYSPEDLGAGICFNVFIYNIQPGILIDYASGDSEPDADYDAAKDSEPVLPPCSAVSSAFKESTSDNDVSQAEESEVLYIVNTSSCKFHYLSCSSVADIGEGNKEEFHGTRDEAVAAGYSPCGRCRP